MSTNTTYYNLIKPGSADFVDISQLDSNFDTIDSNLHSQLQSINNNNSSINTLNGLLPFLNAWTPYSPATAGLTIGNGALLARQLTVGKLVHFVVQLTLGSTSAVNGSVTIDLPSAPHDLGAHSFAGFAFDSSASARIGLHCFNGSGSSVWFRDTSSGSAVLSATNPFTWATGDTLSASGFYEAA